MPHSNNLELTTRSPSIKLKTLRAFNLLSILLASFLNTYFIVFSHSSKEIYDDYPTFFTPSATFVGIFWITLQILQIVFAVFAQLSNIQFVQEIVENAVSWWFTFSNLFLCGQLYFLIRKFFILAELFVLLTLISTSIVHHRLTFNYPPNHLPESVASKIISFIHTPFAMLSAFSLLNLFHIGFIAFAQGYEKKYVIIAILLACIMAIIGVAWSVTGAFGRGKRDGVFNATIAWALLGIAVHQRETKYLSITCLILAIIQLLVIFIVWYRYGGSFTALIGSSPTRRRVSYSQNDLREPLLSPQRDSSLGEEA
ncbi:13827_t:CDS:2 [Funneliformis geosporum]|uniref:15455_t:CDS:1 n=1 Tax=Funneliformis geosporum TaxID=1117311 RepID=A0A9W4SBN1_9GLOM|nr:15455_t:CDS:2 [Funneliformis geosporum]CAI2178285.1 13827_t:CDS:2 [Funneliformis geosporum]